MPPHAPLSARDGRVRSAPTQGGESYYYTNQDIGLLHQIVTLGQELLPTLPKREQLPTTALFRAADVVFPQYGISPDGEDKYSRIIFLVGGLRTTDDLFERFRSVLAQMGIEIEYVESDGEQGVQEVQVQEVQVEEVPVESVPPAQPSATPRSAARVHFDISASTDDDTTEPPRRVPPVASVPTHPLRGGLRRNNSDSTALDHQQYQQHRQRQPFLHRRRRSEPAPPVRQESAQPPRPATAMGYWPEDEGQETEEDQDDQNDQDDEYQDDQDQDDQDLDDQDQDQNNHSMEDHSIEDSGEEHSEDVEDEEVEDEEVEDGDSQDHENDQHEHEDSVHSEDKDQYTRSLELLGAPRISHADSQDMFRDLPIRPRDPPSPSTGQSSSQATFTGLPGASDTLIQDELEYGPPPKVDLHIMAKVADTFFMRFAYQRGQSVQQWREMCLRDLAQKQYAVEMDREMSLSEAVVVWSEVVVEQRMQREGREEEEEEGEEEEEEEVEEEEVEEAGEENEEVGEDSEEDSEDSEGDDDDILQQRDRAMKVAARAYTIALLDKTFTHWQAMAVDEAERTHVARRHLLRRKVFGAWRDQTVQDEATVRALVLGRAVRHWQTATAAVLGNRGWTLAEAVDEHELLAIGLFTWLRVYQERTAVAMEAQRLQTRALGTWAVQSRADGVLLAKADRRARRHLLGLAVDHWVEQAETQAAIRLRIEMEEDETFARAALQDLQKQAFAARQLRYMEATTALVFKETAVAVWRQQTAAAHRQREKLAQQELRDWAVHWVRERRLRQLWADQTLDLQADAVQSWVLAEKLVFLLRYRDEHRVRRACLGLWEATVDENEQLRAADALRCRLMAQSVFFRLRRQRQVHAATDDMADALADGTRAANALDALAVAAQDQHAYVAAMQDMAGRGAYYVAITGALDGWGAHARRAREARLRATYHGLRRGVKRRTAAACVRVWQQAAVPALQDMAGTAVEFQMTCAADLVVGALDAWIRAAHDSLVRTTLAADADVEAYLSRWRLRQAGHAAATAAAAEHEVATRLAARWDVWELQAAVQAQARAHTAAVLREKNERRTLRRVVGVWQEQVREEEEEEEDEEEEHLGREAEEPTRLRLAATLPIRSHWSLSSATPTATAWRLGSSSVQSSTAATTPFSSAVLSKRDDDYYPAAAASFLVPIQESGDLLTNKTPTKAPTTTPRHWPTPAPFQPLKQTLRATAPILGTPASARLRQRLLAASRLADSVQLGPMSEFDEHEGERERADDHDHEDEDDDDDDDGNASSSADAPPRLSTAARHRIRPPSTRPLGARSLMATTTPAGPLPSPFERRLRAAYRSTTDVSDSHGSHGGHSSHASHGSSRWRRADNTTTPMPSRLAGTVAFAYDE